MIYFCADDYGMCKESNIRIEDCIKNGVLNKVSILLNGEISEINKIFDYDNVVVSLHINLIEGSPLCEYDKVKLLISENGYFKYSFKELFFLPFKKKKKEIKAQIYNEIKAQIEFFKNLVGDRPIIIDSHQHTHMIPYIFKILLKVIKDESICVKYIRIPDEPLLPYILTPTLYHTYSIVGIIKQWVLKILAAVNKKEFKKSKIPSAFFLGIMFSGKLNEIRIKKLLYHYMKIANKNNKDIEIGFHPGYVEDGEELLKGTREDFGKFYYSNWRKKEYNTLINFSL